MHNLLSMLLLLSKNTQPAPQLALQALGVIEPDRRALDAQPVEHFASFPKEHSACSATCTSRFTGD